MANNDMTGLTYSQVHELVMGFLKSGDTKTVLYIEGHQGIGKTELLMHCIAEHFGGKDWADKDLRAYAQNELPFFYGQEYPATKQVEDYTGIPFNVDGRTRWTCDERFPLKAKAGGENPKGGYVLEELNQATEEVLKAMFPLLQDKQIAGHVLSPDVHMFITGNPANSIHHVVEFPPALKDRMQRIGMVHSTKDWLEWAREKGGIHEAVTSFIEENNSMLWMMPEDGGVGPTPRAWVSISDSVKKLEKKFIKEYMLVELLKNKVGDKVATKFLGYLKNEFKRAVTAEELIEKFDELLPRYKKQHAAGKAETVESCIKWIEKAMLDVAGKSKEEIDKVGASKAMEVLVTTLKDHTPAAVMMAKIITMDQKAANTLAICKPHGMALIQYAVGVRVKAMRAQQDADKAQKEREEQEKNGGNAQAAAQPANQAEETEPKKKAKKAK